MSDTEHNEQPAEVEETLQDNIDDNVSEEGNEEAFQLDLNNLPPDLANLLQQLQQNPVGNQYFGEENEESEEDLLKKRDYSKLSTATFVEPTLSVRYKVNTRHHHHQLLNLCELNADESGLYLCSPDKGLDEKAYRASLESGTEYVETDPSAEQDDPWSQPPLKKFDFRTQKLFKVPSITLPGIYCIASKYGYIAVNNGGVVQVIREATGQLVEGDFKSSENYHQTNNVFFGTMRKSNGEDQVVLLVSKNGGEITMYDLNEEGDRHISKLRQHIEVRWNINHSAFGFFEFGNYLIGAPDYAEGPIIYQMDDAEQFTLVDTFLTFPHKQTSAMMCTWQAQGPLFAMATERGECVVWHFPSRERVKVLLNCAAKVKALEEEEARRQRGETAPDPNDDAKSNDSLQSPDYWSSSLHMCVRIAKFNPVPLFNYILVYAEANYFIHIVDTRTWDEQVIQTEQVINGLCFSSDGRKIYVAYESEIVVYELILRTSLLETCLHYIRANIAKKEEFGWNLEALPYDLQFKMNY